MIKVNGNTFRTLAEPMYVNGKHVLEAWANGTKVYPETEEGNLFKVKGKLNIICQHTHDGQKHSAYGGACGPCTSYYSVTASFVLVYYISSGITFFMSDEITDLPQDSVNRHGEVYNRMLQAFFPTEDAPIVKNRPILYRIQHNSGAVTTKVKVKYNISPLPICGPIIHDSVVPPSFYETEESNIIFRPDYYGPDPNYYSYFPVNQTLPGPTEFNGTIFHSESNDGAAYSVIQSKAHPHGAVSLGMGTLPQSRSYMDYFSIVASDYRYPLVWPYRDNMTREMVYPTVWPVMNGCSLARIPITDCLYIGNKEDAPEWAQNVYDTDLD